MGVLEARSISTHYPGGGLPAAEVLAIWLIRWMSLGASARAVLCAGDREATLMGEAVAGVTPKHGLREQI